MGNFIKNSIVAVLLTAGLSIATLGFAPESKAGGVPAPSADQIDSTLQTFKDMPPAEREALLKQAMQNLENMTPEERAQMMEVAKARAAAMSGDKLKNYEAQFGGVLTPEQKQRIMGQMQSQVPVMAQPVAAPPPQNAGTVMQQIKTLSPEEKKKLLDELNRTDSAAPPAAK